MKPSTQLPIQYDDGVTSVRKAGRNLILARLDPGNQAAVKDMIAQSHVEQIVEGTETPEMLQWGVVRGRWRKAMKVGTATLAQSGCSRKRESLGEIAKTKNRFEKLMDDEVDGRYNKSGLCMFQTIEPEGCNCIETTGEWECIEMAVDSGASETVVGVEMLQSVETNDGNASKRGVEYEVANGVRIPNVGEKKF